MKKIIVLVGILISMSCHSQPIYKIEKSGDKHFKVITSEDSIFGKLILVTDNQITKVSGIRKQDRKGKYWIWTAYFKNEDIAFVEEQIRIIIKQ